MIPTLSETVVAATITVLANGLGGLPFVFVREFPRDVARLGWSIAGGLMLSASLFNLILPGVEEGGILVVAAGIFLGALLMIATSAWLDRNHIEVKGLTGSGSKRVIMVVATMFIHSFPEGLAVGVAYGSGEVGFGLLMAVAIAIHNIPEGVAVSLPLQAEGVSGWKCVGLAIFSGVPQLLAAVPAYLAVVAFRSLLPIALGFAAGAMIFLVLSEMIPESRSSSQQRLSSAMAGMVGFLGMMVLQNILVV
jgi:ZIP family zinc transporter